MVRFENGRPTGIYYSQHRDGTAYGWDDEALTMTDERVRLLHKLLKPFSSSSDTKC